MRKEIVIPGVSRAIDRLNPPLGGGMLVPELRLDGSRKAFDRAYGSLLQAYDQRLKRESYKGLMFEMGGRIADVINKTARLQRKKVVFAGLESVLDFYNQRMLVDIGRSEDVKSLVYPKLVIFSQADIQWALGAGVILDSAIYQKYTRPAFEKLLKRGIAFVVRSDSVYFNSGPLRRKYGIK